MEGLHTPGTSAEGLTLQGAYNLVELKDNFKDNHKCIIINHGEYYGQREQGIPKRVDCCWQEEIGEDLSEVER